MSQPEVIGEVIVRVKPVMDDQELARVVEQATAAASQATSTAGRASLTAGSAVARAGIASSPRGVEGLYTRGAITNQLIGDFRSEIDQMQAMHEADFGRFAQSMSFPGKLPGEITRQLQGHPARKAIRGLLSTNVPGGNAPDLMAEMGEEAYFRGLEYMAGSPAGHALEAASKFGSPRQQLLAGLARAQARGGSRLGPMEHILAGSLATGSRLSIGGYEHQVIEPDEGERYLRGPLARQDLPLEGLGIIPHDIGSLRMGPPPLIGDFTEGLEGYSGGAAGRRIPLQQYRRGQHRLGGPRSRLGLPHQYGDVYGPAIPMGAGQSPYFLQSGAYSPTDDAEFENFTRARSSFDQYQTYQRLMSENPKLRPILADAIDTHRKGFESRGYADYDGRMGVSGGGRKPPPPGGFIDVMPEPEDRGPVRPGLTDADFSRGRYTGIRPPRVRGRGSRFGNALDSGMTNFGEYLAGQGRRATLLGMTGRAIFGGAARKAFGGMRPANQLRALKAGALVNRLGNTPFMSFGNYMNLFFGGGEVLGAVTSLTGSRMMAGATSDVAQRAQVELQGFQQASSGFFGRFGSLLFDPLGKRQGQIGVDLDVAGRMDAFTSMERELYRSTRGAGRAAAFTGAGRSIRGLADSIGGMTEARAKAMADYDAQSAVLVDQAGANAGAEWDRIGPTNFRERARTFNGALTRDEAVENARISASQSRSGRRDSMLDTLKQADMANMQASVRDIVEQTTRSTEDFRTAAQFVGNPVAAQRTAMQARFARENADRLSQRGDLITKMIAGGMTQDQANAAYDQMSTAFLLNQAAEADAFSASVNFSQDRIRGAAQRSQRVNRAMRGVMRGEAGSRAELDSATGDDMQAARYEELTAAGMSDEEADIMAARDRSDFDENRLAKRQQYLEFQQRLNRQATERRDAGMAFSLNASRRVTQARRALNKGGSRLAVSVAAALGNAEQQAYGIGQAGGNMAFGGLAAAGYLEEIEAVRSQFLSEFRPVSVKSLDSIDTSGKQFGKEMGAISAGKAGVSSILNFYGLGYSQYMQDRANRIYIEKETNPGF